MTPYANWLSESKPTSVTEIVAANNHKMTVSDSDKITLRVNNENVDVNNVLYVPDLSTNLLSVDQMVKKWKYHSVQR